MLQNELQNKDDNQEIGTDESESFGVDKPINYQDIQFISDADDNTHFQLFKNVKNLDKLRKLQQEDKSVTALDVDAKLIDAWVTNVDKIVYLSDLCERDGSLNPATIDNILLNVFKIKQLTEYVRLHPDNVVKYGVAGISVPYGSLYASINAAIEKVKMGISSDKRMQKAISTLFIGNSSLMTTDNKTGLKMADITVFNDESAAVDPQFDLSVKLVEDCEPIVIDDMLVIIDIAASLFVIEKGALGVSSEALVMSESYKRIGAFNNLCTILASMMIMFIEDDDMDFSLLDGML